MDHPRQRPKADLPGEALIHATWSPGARTVRYRGDAKPSIDTAVHADLYRRLPALAALLHTHEGLAVDPLVTARSWPCGVVEEADELQATLGAAAESGRWDGGPFAIEMAEHGLLLGLEEGASRAWPTSGRRSATPTARTWPRSGPTPARSGRGRSSPGATRSGSWPS